MNIEEIAGLSLKDGIWRATVSERISYTQDGHNLIEGSEQASFWYQHRLDVIMLLIKAFRVTELLDIGGGNGQIAKFLQDNGVTSILLEPMTVGAENAYSAGLNHVINASFGELDLPDDIVQTIGLFDVLEHIERDDQFLDKAYSILKPGGLVFITVPALPILYSDFDREVGHFRRYTLTALEEKLRQVGFNITYKSYLFMPLPFLIWPMRVLYRYIRKPQKRREFGHIHKKTFLGRMINTYLRWEVKMVSRMRRIPLGSSCLVVATKGSHE